MNQPSISIVVPVYNAEKNLPHTIQSLKQQTCRDFEVLFVDDGSPDDSVTVIRDLLQDSPINWRLVRQENQGLGAARNTGFYEAKGQWILFLDADDALQAYAVEEYCRIAGQYPAADVIFFQFWNVSAEDALKQALLDTACAPIDRQQLLKGFLTRELVFLVPGTLYRRDFLQRTGVIHTTIPWSEDQYFMWQVLNSLERAVISRAVIYNYVHHAGPSIMRATPIDKMLLAYEQYCCLPAQLEDPLVKKHLLPRWCLGCLHVLAKRGDNAAFSAFWQAVDFTAQCVTLLGFPAGKVRALAAAGLVSKQLMYRLMR